jgi:predicted RNA-binding protein associated with RNAse of E/G family
LPRVLEIKRTLAGREKRFDCGVLLRTEAHLVVLFVADEAMHVHGVELPAGTVTFGHFWPSRPYNVYHWLDRATGRTIGAYVNLSEDTRLGVATLEWLDLAIDVLALPGLPPRVLDEEEVPADATPALRERILRTTTATLDGLPALLEELERFRTDLWPRARGVLGVP